MTNGPALTGCRQLSIQSSPVKYFRVPDLFSCPDPRPERHYDALSVLLAALRSVVMSLFGKTPNIVVYSRLNREGLS